MSTKRELSWFAPRGLYKKVYKGRTYYLKTRAASKADALGYKAALAEWEAVKAYADGEGPNPYPSGEWNARNYQHDYARWVLATAEYLQPEPEQRRGVNLDHAAAFATNYSKHTFRAPAVAATRRRDISISALVDEYLDLRQAESRSGSLSIKQYAQDKAKLNDFLGFCCQFDKRLLSQLDSQFLSFYRQAQLELTAMAEDGVSHETAKKRLQTVLRILNWAYARELLDKMPRVLRSGYTKIEIKRPKPKFWTADDLRTIYNAASKRTQLYILLAANCGYTQAEIASLEWEHLKQEPGGGWKVQRERPKTGQPQTHLLWDITYRTLCRESKSSSGIVLVGQKGNGLLEQRIKEDGNVTHCDVVRLAFQRTLTKLGWEKRGKSFKNIRKTSAQALLTEYQDERIVDVFLAHSTKGVMRNHYTQPVLTKYFEAVAWLEGWYRFEQP